MYGKTQRFILLLLLILVPGTVLAKPEVVLEMTSEKEVVEEKNEKKVVKRVPATEVEPGQVLIFTMKYLNKGDEKATNVVVDNPIPRETVYVVDSATGKGSVITFSINNGKDYKRASLLTYEVKGPDGKKIKKKASPDQYTDIRWIINEIPPGGSGELSYQARVK